jgi:RNA polymerase sigma-70 factor (ECF subfamily)
LLDQTTLTGLYREHTAALYQYVSRRVGGDRSLAEDIVQDAWLRAVDHWPRRGVPDNPRAWLVRVAHNLIASHFRRRRPRFVDPTEIEFGEEPSYPDTPSAAALVSWGLSRLRRNQSLLLEAFYLEGKSTREIAEGQGLSERAVEGRLRRARQNLEKRLRPFVRSDSSGAAESGAEIEAEPASVLELTEGGRRHA